MQFIVFLLTLCDLDTTVAAQPAEFFDHGSNLGLPFDETNSEFFNINPGDLISFHVKNPDAGLSLSLLNEPTLNTLDNGLGHTILTNGFSYDG